MIQLLSAREKSFAAGYLYFPGLVRESNANTVCLRRTNIPAAVASGRTALASGERHVRVCQHVTALTTTPTSAAGKSVYSSTDV